jgi:hypothetical protein
MKYQRNWSDLQATEHPSWIIEIARLAAVLFFAGAFLFLALALQ